MGRTSGKSPATSRATNFGWLARAALDAPKWRWMGINHANAALTVIRCAPGRPPSVLFFNDMGHLPADLRWTGFPPDLRI